MKILFVHQRLPGQFKHLAPALARAGHDVRFLTQREGVSLPGIPTIVYPKPRAISDAIHPYVRLQEESVLAGQQAARWMLKLRQSGFAPDLVIGHPGWGELLFVKDVLPQAKLLDYCEFFYQPESWYKGFDLEDPPQTLDERCRESVQSAHLLLTLNMADAGLAPTHWQKSVHPAPYHDRISVIFDGIDTAMIAPDPEASLVLPGNIALKAGDEVLTYVSRTLEPTRGFRTFMRALPRILGARPQVRVVIVGGDEGGYGAVKPIGFASWREAMLAEVEVDPARVHFTGKLPYSDYLRLLRITRAHVYLTSPFVLSWSCFEALASGALVIGSDTAPVREVIRDGENGVLTDFFDVAGLADKAIHALAEPAAYARHRQAARATALEHYAVDICVPRQLALVDRLMQ